MKIRVKKMILLKKHLEKFHRDEHRCFVVFYALLFLITAIGGVATYGAGYRYNRTSSVARGVWKVHDKTKLQKNDYVFVSPKGNPGYELALQRKYMFEHAVMLKKIIALEGDHVSYDVDEKAVTVNGEYIFMTEILSQDTEGRPLQGATFPVFLKKGEIWLSSEFIRGYDSRYFGPVSADILTKATPVWIYR